MKIVPAVKSVRDYTIDELDPGTVFKYADDTIDRCVYVKLAPQGVIRYNAVNLTENCLVEFAKDIAKYIPIPDAVLVI